MFTRIFRSFWASAFIVAITWQVLLAIAGFILERRYSLIAPADLTALSHMTPWDGGWFRSIVVENAYEFNGAAPVFYPLFPLLVAIVESVGFGLLSVTAAAFIVNGIATWLAIVALGRIAEQFGQNKYRWLVIALFLTSPAAIFLHFFYAEAVFCALAFWAYLFALRRHWVYMAIALSFLMIVKIPALLIIGLCGLEFMRAHQWSPRKLLNRNLLSFAIVPLGFIGYGLYLQKIRGDFLGMIHGYDHTDDWAYHVFDPNFLAPILEAAKTSVKLVLGRADDLHLALVNAVLPFVGLGLLGLASLYALFVVKGKGIPLGIASLISIVFFTLNSNVVSVHRYLLPCLVLYLVPVMLMRKYRLFSIVVAGALVAGLALQYILYMFFVGGRFAG